MNELTPMSPIHFYDVRARGIPCGVHGTEHRSTKHVRGVTCRACVELLRERPAMPAAEPDAASAAP